MTLFEQLELLERWLPVVGYEGWYEVSDWGRVRRVARGRGARIGKVMNQSLSHGYPALRLSKDGKSRLFRVHILVTRAFLGLCPPAHEVDHKNRDRTCNLLSNLRYRLKSENAALHGEDHHQAKLKGPEVIEIRRLYKEGMDCPQIAAIFGIHKAHVWRIVKLKSWKLGEEHDA
jgi:hypothetical protein